MNDVRRGAILTQYHRLKSLNHAIGRGNNLISIGNSQRTSGTKVVLNVDHKKCIRNPD